MSWTNSLAMSWFQSGRKQLPFEARLRQTQPKAPPLRLREPKNGPKMSLSLVPSGRWNHLWVKLLIQWFLSEVRRCLLLSDEGLWLATRTADCKCIDTTALGSFLSALLGYSSVVHQSELRTLQDDDLASMTRDPMRTKTHHDKKKCFEIVNQAWSAMKPPISHAGDTKASHANSCFGWRRSAPYQPPASHGGTKYSLRTVFKQFDLDVPPMSDHDVYLGGL